MVLPVVPSLMFNWVTTPFIPSLLEVTNLKGMLGTCGYYGWLEDGNCSIHCKVLINFLFLAGYRNRDTWIDALIKPVGAFSCQILQ